MNIIKGYLDQLSKYISISRNMSIEDSEIIAKKILTSKFKDKSIKYFERKENGDRVVKDSSLLEYINTNYKEGNILAPTFTSYINKSVKESIHSGFTENNVKTRSKAKKQAQEGKISGDMELFTSKNNEQSRMKIYNNSLSGAYGQMACMLYNPTAHSTLTSITRTMTSLANCNNEKMLGGNRVYMRNIDVLNDITYILSKYNKPKLIEVVDKYNLHKVTVDETIEVLKWSSDLYFRNNEFYNTTIRNMLSKLDSYDRCAIVYTGDLWHIKKYNDVFMRNMLTELSTKVLGENKEEYITSIYKYKEDILNTVNCIYYNSVKGYGKKYDKMYEDGFLGNIYSTCKSFSSKVEGYKAFIECFITSDIVPIGSTKLENMRRRIVVLSDTDSTCVTMDKWVEWYSGKYIINETTIGVSSCVLYLLCKGVEKLLYTLSKNMNVDKKDLEVLSMKNEYLWGIHAPCEISKHYFASTLIQEGNVFNKPEIEIKGVHLKNSANPVTIIEDSKQLIKSVLDRSIDSNINLETIITDIIKLENSINDSVNKGESLYLKKSKIKGKDAYAKEERLSPYIRHLLWIEVFEETYGKIDEPPYGVIKIPTTVTKSTDTQLWLDSISNVKLKDRLSSWLITNKKNNLPTIYLNEDYVKAYGIPKEILSIINVRRIILDVTMQHRVILETLGVILYKDLLIREQFL